jgi:hypothetical protein
LEGFRGRGRTGENKERIFGCGVHGMLFSKLSVVRGPGGFDRKLR